MKRLILSVIFSMVILATVNKVQANPFVNSITAGLVNLDIVKRLEIVKPYVDKAVGAMAVAGAIKCGYEIYQRNKVLKEPLLRAPERKVLVNERRGWIFGFVGYCGIAYLALRS